VKHPPHLRPVPDAVTPARRPRPVYQPPSPQKLAEIMRETSNRPVPRNYEPSLAECAAGYRVTDEIPRTDYNKLNALPKGMYRRFPEKAREAISLASSDAKLIFWSLWDQHETKKILCNGLLIATHDDLQKKTGIGRRADVSRGLIELEVRGLVRIARGRAGGGRAYENMALLTCFADCLGNPPAADYETAGIPEWSRANNGAARNTMNDEIAAKFKRTIDMQIELVRYLRNMKGETR
jgi:hypothetical protein